MKASKIILWTIVLIVIILTILLIVNTPKAEGATNISSVLQEHFAWNEITSWWDFYATNNVNVTDAGITGYASSSLGPVIFDSTSCPGGPCSIQFNVVNESSTASSSDTTCNSVTITGKLKGYAWNDTIGWISMSCTNENPSCAPGDPAYYRVSINRSSGPTQGDFSGWAWNDVVGWISFNNADYGGGIQHKVKTSWQPGTPVIACLISPTIDTRSSTTLNSILWQGIKYPQTYVDFQIATSNSPTGPWNFFGPGIDPEQSDATGYYSASCDAISGFLGGQSGSYDPNTPICVNPNFTKDSQYLRYKVRLRSDPTQTLSPHVDDIILNWSQ